MKSPGAPRVLARRLLGQMLQLWPGVLVCATISIAATWLSEKFNGPSLLTALIMGFLFNHLRLDARYAPGLSACASGLLKLGIVLVGVRISFDQILSLGFLPIAVVTLAVGSTILFGVVAARFLGQSITFGVLSGGAVGICGASAALAISAVLPKSERTDREAALTIACVTLLSTVAMFLYPVLAVSAGFDAVAAGIFIGGSIHDVAQVIGAGYSISETAGDHATYVKLLRVALLLPVAICIGTVFAWIHSKDAASRTGKRTAFAPFFLLGFAAIAILHNVHPLAAEVKTLLVDISQWCLIAAIAALGVRTPYETLHAVGRLPLMLLMIESAWIGLLMLAIAATVR